MNPTRCTCGCMPTLIHVSDTTYVYNCYGCGVGGFTRRTKEEAIIDWNNGVSHRKLQLEMEKERQKLAKWKGVK